MKAVFAGLFLSLPLLVHGEEPTIAPGCVAHFASAEEGAKILGTRDDFVQRLSPFDRAARLKTDKPVSEEQFLSFARKAAQPWSEAEVKAMSDAISTLRPALQDLRLAFPPKIVFIKTTGAEEGRAFYTRDNAIMLPDPALAGLSAARLADTIAHELFHVLSRKNPPVREQLYQAIGFSPCQEIAFPPELKSRKITNPDAPRNDHSIQLRTNGRTIKAVPILFSKTSNYEPARGGEFFEYLEMKFLAVSGTSTAQPELIELAQAEGFFEQVGRNTDYVIHPEEILAENFRLWIRNDSNVRSPEIIEKIRQILAKKP